MNANLFFDFLNQNNFNLLLVIILGILICAILTYFIYIFIFGYYNKKKLNYFFSGKNNIRLFTLNYEEGYVYVIDKKNFKVKRKETFDWFFSSFPQEDVLKIKVWLSEIVNDDRQVNDSIEVNTIIKKQKEPIFSVLTCTRIDTNKKIFHLESHFFPKIVNIKVESKKDDKILSYNELSNIYHSEKNEKFNIYFIHIYTISDDNISDRWTKKVIIATIMSRMKSFMKNSMRMCITRNNDLIILEPSPGNKNKSISFGHKMSDEINRIFHLNTLQSAYSYKIGIATRKNDFTFDELVRSAKEMTLVKDDTNKKVYFDAALTKKDSQEKFKNEIKNIMHSKKMHIEYSTLVNCNNGHVKGFYSQIIPKSNIFNNLREMEDYASSFEMLDEFLEFIFEQINSIYINRYFITTEKRRLFIPIKPQYYKSVINIVTEHKLPDNLKNVFVLNDKDIAKESMSNSKFLHECLERLSKVPDIRLGLEFTSTSLEMSDDILKVFDYFIFNFKDNFPNILSSTHEQILFQDLRDTLLTYPRGKLTAVNLTSWQSIEYFTLLGFRYVSSPYFGKEVNKAPQIDVRKINKLLSIKE